MFGEPPHPPRPPWYEPFVLALIAVIIALVLTAGYWGLLRLAERMEQAG